MRLLLIAALMLPLITTSCSKKTNPPAIQEEIPPEVDTEVYDKTEVTTKDALVPTDTDCHGKRIATREISDMVGYMTNMRTQWIISSSDGTERYMPCKVDTKYQVDSLKVLFTGSALEIFPNERLIATPFRLSSIRETD